MSDEKKTEKHPSFAMVGFHRSTGGIGRLFGSPLKHHSSVTLTIKAAERERNLSNDFIFGRETLVEVEMSENQFAQAITSLNMGDGVPCTVRYLNRGDRLERIPEPPVDHEAETFQKEIREDVREVVETLQRLQKRAKEVLGAPGPVKKDDKTDLLDMIYRIEQQVRANMPFVLDQYHERLDKLTTAAKADIDAFLTSRAQQLGLGQLAGQRTALALTAHDDHDEHSTMTGAEEDPPHPKTSCRDD